MTNEPITTERQRELFVRLRKLAARRMSEGSEAAKRDEARTADAQRRYDRLRDESIAEFERQHAALIEEFKAARENTYSRYESQGEQLAVEESRCYQHADQELAESIADSQTLRQHRIHEILRAFREQKAVPRSEYVTFKQQCQVTAGEVNALVIKAQSVVRRRCPWPEDDGPHPPPLPGLTKQQYLDHYADAMGRAYQRLIDLQNQPAARFVEDGWPILIFLAALLIAAALFSWLLFSAMGWLGVAAASVIVALLLAVGSRQAARPYARQQTLRIVPDFQQAIAEARTNLAAAVSAAKAAAEQAHRQLVERRDADLAAAKAEFKRLRQEQRLRHEERTRQAEKEHAAQRKLIEEKYERRLDELEEKYPAEIERLELAFVQKMEMLRGTLRQHCASSRQQRERDLADLTAEWKSALAEFESAAERMNAICDGHFAPWESIDWKSWQPPGKVGGNGQPVEPPMALRFGRHIFGLPAGDDGPSSYELPAVVSYPERPSLLLESEGEGREVATRVLQNVMLRLLTTFPPGKVRFTIIDPVGLGQNFSAFMHLADYDEKLVNSRIWTETPHINQRLADLTEHMENVIQKYLRNEFASIQEYNEHAGEVAEPFQILVIANFPANFSDDAARRLAAIATSGARCGVYTLISTDAKLALPRNFELTDLEAGAATLIWDAERRRFAWKCEDLRNLPLALEMPPDDDQFTEIVRTVGRLAKDAARVEVPFEMVTPAGAWWTADSRGGVEAPLGRAGAKNMQFMRLGKGTSQHVLISGKTGSGKSTLLNALITNLALYYSPDELEFYLIDFKKGVEFKAYAAMKLPHARVIAIESEREFGISVLERLDQELKRRGNLFRTASVQDLKGFRDNNPSTKMPRVLLIIDEFQEFFTSDDRIAHDAALLLDRLVRQGRAFGIHVLLGSQTLAGAYSLARSTLGQMAVRIALQCSEADAHLILSEDNTAARLLNRPGEAIYNDANGLFEGNHPFQVVWLSDEEREDYLRRVAELAEQRQLATQSPIVFEGNAAAVLSENQLLLKAVETAPVQPRPAAAQAWLGAAVAIKDPTDAVFRPQSGSNLLVVGQQDELSLGILASSVISLAAQLGPIGGAASLVAPTADSPAGLRRFYVLDGTRPDTPESGFWHALASHQPLDVKVAPVRETTQTISDLADEVARRLASGDQAAGEPVFLVIYNLARFRDLKKADDYSFGDDDNAGAGKKLAAILREGPAVGVHTLVWCDSYNNVNRWFDRQALRDFEMRVLFQMSATDSSNLMDNPAASRLGAYTAIFYSEERGQAEKFRPYGLPAAQWLRSVNEQLAARSSVERVRA